MKTQNRTNLCDLCFAAKAAKNSKCPCCNGKSNLVEYPTSLKEGKILAGKFKVGKVLGKGGFGITYLCYDLKYDRKIVIKEFMPDYLVHRNSGESVVSVKNVADTDNYKAYIDKFYNEAVTVSKFNGNPNIISVYEFFRENNTAYFTMEYLNGTDMKDYLKTKRCMSENEVVYVFRQMLDALEIVHSRKILHRDISPDNIFLCADGSVKLIDFGAARQIIGEESKSLSVILKEGFAPLEQYSRNGNQGSWTDIYALGSTMYYALTGKVINDPNSRIDNESIDMTGISYELAEILNKMMKLKISDRYQSVQELKNDINALEIVPKAPQIQISDDAVEPTTKHDHDSKLKKILIAAVAAFVLLIAAGISVLLFDINNQSENIEASSNNGGIVNSVEYENKNDNETVSNCKHTKTRMEYGPKSYYQGAYWVRDVYVICDDCGNISTKEMGADGTAGVDTCSVCEQTDHTTSEHVDLIDAGWFGETVTWKLCTNGTLYISGNGQIAAYDSYHLNPLNSYRDKIINVVIAEGVTAVEKDVFMYCRNLANVSLPASLVSIDRNAFSFCENLTYVHVDGNNSYYSSADGVLFNKDKSVLLFVPGGVMMYTVPDSVKYINDYAFYDCNKLISVNTGNGVVSVGAHAFSCCENLESVELSNTLEYIGLCAFYGCSNLKSITIPDSVNTVESYAFYQCKDLQAVTIPGAVTNVGECIFRWCDSLTNIYVKERTLRPGTWSDKWLVGCNAAVYWNS